MGRQAEAAEAAVVAVAVAVVVAVVGPVAVAVVVPTGRSLGEGGGWGAGLPPCVKEGRLRSEGWAVVAVEAVGGWAVVAAMAIPPPFQPMPRCRCVEDDDECVW